MAVRRDHDLDEDDRTQRVERVERVEHFHEAAPAAAAPQTNVNTGAATSDVVTIVTRVVLLVFTALEVMLLFRFAFKLAGANAQQPLISALYAFTEPLVRPFQGIFPEPQTGVVVDIAALLAILFLFLIGWLIVALVRAIAGRTAY